METRERVSGRRGRLGALFLAAVLVCALLTGFAQAAPAEGGSAILESAAPKPQITIQGNVVVDKGKPTGFYELALCVQTARTVTVKGTDTVVDDKVYADALAAAAEGDEDALKDFFNNYDVKNYPFQSAAAAMYINLDALTAVTWGAGKPIYDDWSATGGTSGSYTTDAARDTHYPRGINKNSEEVKDQPQIFTDLDPILNNTGIQQVRVRLDSAKPDEVNNATAFIEKAEFSETDATKRTALLTLSANTTTTANVVYATPTPVVVVRFAYDMERFTKLEVGNPRDLVNEPNESDFWLGLDKNDNDPTDKDLPMNSGKTPLTYLGARDASGNMYATSDGEVARSSVFQSVLYAQNLADDGVTQQTTRFYYYLGAEAPSYQNTPVTVSVLDEATGNDSAEKLHLPVTEGSAVLAPWDDKYATPGDPDAPGATEANGKYSFFQNLLRKADDTLRLDLVNAETYRKPTGGVGGAQILFYDWDDSLIGALVVDPEGDARALVNEYVEKTFIHPKLRASAMAEGAKDLTELPAQPDYNKYHDLVNSLEREHTYRGDYAYTVGGDNDPDQIFGPDSDEPGEDYPLTDKLDYAFYRRVTTQTEVDVPDPQDPAKTVKTRYYSTAPVDQGPVLTDPEEEYDGYLYPYVYGWAIVEDGTQDLTKKNWILHKDSVKTEDVWTTFGVGELADLDPANATAQTIPGTTTNYTYAVTEKDAAWYLRFADFSAMEKMLRPGQDVLIVKAVYEPGRSLLTNTHYSVVEDSLHMERYSYAASTGAAVYSFQYQYRRASTAEGGAWRGVKRTREPAIQTGYTYDVNVYDDEGQNLDYDPLLDTGPLLLKTLSNNGEILNIDITTSGEVWKIDYKLLDIYGGNLSTGAQRSAGGELNLKNNFDYTFKDGTEYPDRQGTDGFVMRATLNTLLAEATKAAKNETNSLETHASLATINDMNWKADESGKTFSSGNYRRVATYIQDLVTRLYASNDPQYRDPKTGDIVLGWHQLQRHILMCMKAGSAVPGIYDGGVLMSETACAGFPWCRLDTCAAEMTVDIYTIGDILAAIGQAEGETGDKRPATEALNKLLTDNPSLLDSFWLRKSEIGEKFPEGAGHRQAVLNALKKVYADLKKEGVTDPDTLKDYSQEQVQEVIITGTKPSTPVQKYWWANGGKRPVTGWQDFIEGGMLVVSGKVPDALDDMTNDNPDLANAVNDMISYAPPTGAPANVGWFRYKESEEEDNAFTDVEQFKEKWLKALEVLSAHYTLYVDGKWTSIRDTWNTIPWAEIQYALIEESYKPEADVLKSTNYWWKDGGQPRLTYERLMEAASEWRANGFADSSKLDKLLAKGITPINNEIYLRLTAAGTAFRSKKEFMDQLKLAMQVLGFVTNSNTFAFDSGALKYTEDPVTHEKTYALDIYQLQHLLIQADKLVGQAVPDAGKIKDPTDPDVRCNYWWIAPPHTPTSAQNINDIMDLLTYTFWYRDGADGTALPFALDKLDAATLTKLKLRAEEHGVPFTDETPDQLKQSMVDMLNNGFPFTADTFSNQTPADLTRIVQYILLHKSYPTTGGVTETYWWQTEAGFQAKTHETLAQAGWMAAVGFPVDGSRKTVPDAMDQIIDLDFITRRTMGIKKGLAMRADAEGGAFVDLNHFKKTLKEKMQAAAAANSAFTYDKLTGFTDYQLQYLLLNGEYKTDAEVKALVIHDDKDDYWWFTLDEKPGEEEGPKWVPKTPDPAVWSDFITKAISYGVDWDDTALGSDPLSQEYLSNTLLLRDESGNELDPETFYVCSFDDMLFVIADTISSRGSGASATWYEFQYVLSHYTQIVTDGGDIPSLEECKTWLEKQENAPWAGEMQGGAKPVFTPPDAATWSDFITKAISYGVDWDDTALGSDPLSQEYLSNTLLLRDESGNELDPETFYVCSFDDMLFVIADTISSRGSGADATWYEFQYVLSHYTQIVTDGGDIPSLEECKTWLETEGNAPWAWKDPAAGASLLSLEEEPPVPLAAMPDDMLQTDESDAVDETNDLDDTPQTDIPTESTPVGPDALIGPTTDETPTPDETDETAEIPQGDEMVTVQWASGGMAIPLSRLCRATSLYTREADERLPGQDVGRDDSARRTVAGPGGASPSPTSPAATYSAVGAGLAPPANDLWGLDLLRNAALTRTLYVTVDMAGPMILPLSLRRTMR